MFSLNRKVKDLVPYDPIEGTYRIRLDANESYITLPLEIKEEIAQTAKDIHFSVIPTRMPQMFALFLPNTTACRLKM